MLIKNVIEKARNRTVFITILAENSIRSLLILYLLNVFSNKELSSLGIIQATMGVFMVILPLGFGVSSQRFSIEISSKEFSIANTIYYGSCLIQSFIVYLIWDFLIILFAGLNFLETHHKFTFLALCFLKIELAKSKAISRINDKKNIFILLSALPISVEVLLILNYIDNSSTAFDLFFIRVVSMSPVLIFTIYLFKYLDLKILERKVIIYSLITIPNKLVTGALGYFMNLFAFNLGENYMAKFYSSLKVGNILNTVLDAYYQYAEPSFYKKKGVSKKQFKNVAAKIIIISLLFIFGLLVFCYWFPHLKLTENLSLKIIFLLAAIYISTVLFRLVSFKLFFNLRNDLIFGVNLLIMTLFLIISYYLPIYFLEALAISLVVKVLVTFHLDKIILKG